MIVKELIENLQKFDPNLDVEYIDVELYDGSSIRIDFVKLEEPDDTIGRKKQTVVIS